MNTYTTGMMGNSAENSAVVSHGPCIVLMAAATNYDSANAKTVMLFDAVTLPANGAVPTFALPLALSGFNSFPFPQGGVPFRNGVCIALSTTAKTLTVDTTSGGNAFFQVFTD